MPAPPPLRAIRAAFVFLTRLPVPGSPFRADDWRWAPAHFPLVGASVGALLAAVWMAVQRAGALGAAAVVVTTSLLVTGAFHEDGLADTADALGGGTDRERVLTILKDSRVGAFGAAALVCALTLRVVLLARLAPLAPAVLIATQCAARTPPVWLLAALPYVSRTDEAKSAAVSRTGLTQAALATLWPVAVLAVLIALHAVRLSHAVAIVVAGSLSGLVCGWRFRARLGGVTGDLLGALEQVSECTMLLAVALVDGKLAS